MMKAPPKPACCPADGCTNPEVGLCYDRHTQTLHWRCELHADDIVSPYDGVNCPHCDCYFRVN